MRGSQWQPSVSGCARMRALPSTCATHQAPGTDRQLHCPHLTWQAVTVRSDRSVPGLFICCRWERSWVGQIALHTERQPSLLWSVSNRVRAQPRCIACHRTSCRSFFFFFFCRVRNQTCFAGFIYWWQVYVVSCLAMSTGDLSSSARSGVPRRSTSRWVSLSLSLVHRHSQWNCDVRGSRGRPGPAVAAA